MNPFPVTVNLNYTVCSSVCASSRLLYSR